jgi:hypothetical protein
MKRSPALVVLLAGTLSLTACGSDDGGSARSSTTARATPAPTAAAGADLGAIKDYLTDHSAALERTTAELAAQGQRYQALAAAADYDYAALLTDRRKRVAGLVRGMQRSWRTANPQYEEMEGVVAGVPELSEYDVIIDAGSDGSDPESAVPFDVEVGDGRVLEKPGNFFFLTETSLFGTNSDFQAEDVKADLDGDGKVRFGEAVPDAQLVRAFTRDFAAQAAKLNASAHAWEPEQADAFQALVTMTPTMSEYFEQWKNSRAIAGGTASEAGFVGASRLQDIESILSGLVLIYDNVQPSVAKTDAAQAEQTRRDLTGLRDFAADLREREEAGTKFDAEQADTLGAEAQARAEAIAGQVSQAAAQLGIELES